MSSSESDSKGGKEKSIDGRGIATSFLGAGNGEDFSGGGTGKLLSALMEADLTGKDWDEVGGAINCSVGRSVIVSSGWATLLTVPCSMLGVVTNCECSCLCFARKAFARTALAGSPYTSWLGSATASVAAIGEAACAALVFSVVAPSSLSSVISFSRCCLNEVDDEVLEPVDCSIVSKPSADSDSSSAVVNEKTVSCCVKVSRMDWNCTANRTVTTSALSPRIHFWLLTLQQPRCAFWNIFQNDLFSPILNQTIHW